VFVEATDPGWEVALHPCRHGLFGGNMRKGEFTGATSCSLGGWGGIPKNYLLKLFNRISVSNTPQVEPERTSGEA
tara:strand:- start:2909 stop:3133 length:225 start_codon:yes stop_codon:yes gene_type:complete